MVPLVVNIPLQTDLSAEQDSWRCNTTSKGSVSLLLSFRSIAVKYIAHFIIKTTKHVSVSSTLYGMDKWEGVQMVRRGNLNHRVFPTERRVLPRLDPKLLHCFSQLKEKTPDWQVSPGSASQPDTGFPPARMLRLLGFPSARWFKTQTRVEEKWDLSPAFVGAEMTEEHKESDQQLGLLYEPQ